MNECIRASPEAAFAPQSSLIYCVDSSVLILQHSCTLKKLGFYVQEVNENHLVPSNNGPR
jgi:hypothetical protein